MRWLGEKIKTRTIIFKDHVQRDAIVNIPSKIVKDSKLCTRVINITLRSDFKLVWFARFIFFPDCWGIKRGKTGTSFLFRSLFAVRKKHEPCSCMQWQSNGVYRLLLPPSWTNHTLKKIFWLLEACFNRSSKKIDMDGERDSMLCSFAA